MEKARIFIIICLCMATYPLHSFAESIVNITAVSRSEKTFVIDYGVKEGITLGQESYFSSPNTSVKAMVIKVSRNFSLWKISNPRLNMPFIKGQMCNYSNAREHQWITLAQNEAKLIADKKEETKKKKREIISRFP